MLYICNQLASFFINLLFFFVNIWIWVCYASIASICVSLKDKKWHMRLRDIHLYKHDLYINTLAIVYYINYKSIVHASYIYYDIKDKLTLFNQSTPDVIPSNKADMTADTELESIHILTNSIKSLCKNCTCIIDRMKIKIDEHLIVTLHSTKIQKSATEYTISISTIYILYDTVKIATCKHINITYLYTTNQLVIDISLITIKLLSYEVDIQHCIQHIITLLSVEDTPSNICLHIFIRSIHVNFFNKHVLHLYVHNIKYHSDKNSFFIQECILQSGKKCIANISNIDYSLATIKSMTIETIRLHIYKTTMYKLKLCLDSLLPKHKKSTKTRITRKKTTKNMHLQSCLEKNYIKSITVDNHSTRSLSDVNIPLVKKSIMKQIFIHTLCINIKYTPNIYIICKSLAYTRYTKHIYTMLIQSIRIKDMYDKCYIQTKYNNSNYIQILFKQHFLNIQIVPLTIDIHIDIIKGVLDIIEANAYDFKKLLYYDYIKNNYSEYFIHHLFIHSIMLDVTYKPKKNKFYKQLFSKHSRYAFLQITNYKNIRLYTKEIDIYYPLDSSYLCNKILEIWFKDIYKHQLTNVLKGAQYTKKISSTLDYSSKLFKKVKKKLS